ncbi:MAG: hypothetical protein JSW63_04030 [Ignavibacterium sp.]|nr:MAG: hypothetical protein JSW63_04030 [Ignavibacterium sp.]
MQKIALILLPFVFIACDKTFDEIVDTTPNNYQVTSVSPVDSFTYSSNDSLITIRIVFSISSEVGNVFCDVIASDGTKLNESPFQLLDIGNNRFSNDFPLSEFYPNGIYDIKYYVQNLDQTLQQVAIGSFKFNNGQSNRPPVIANTVIEPDTVVVDTTVAIFTSVEASDSNGQNDIKQVFFVVYRPDGSSSGTRNQLFDDGDTIQNGDLVAGDGIYSLLIQVNETNTKGTYRFEFQAEDRGGKFSNKIDHFVLIQ